MIRQISTGEITDAGLRPQSFAIQRGEAEAETAQFQRDLARLAFKRGNASRSAPLARETQDMQSFLFQMAYEVPNMAGIGSQIEVSVTNARKVYKYQFKYMGEEQLRMPFGEVRTVHLLSAASNPEDSYEMWLAPDYFYLPMRLKFYLGKFPVEQRATRISSKPSPPTDKP